MPRYTAKQFIKAIKGSGGIISEIADRVGCDWHTAEKWVRSENAPSTVAAAYTAECEFVADLAESVIINRLNAGDEATAKWYLSRIRRGKYSARQELTGADGEQLASVNQIRIVNSDSSDSSE